MRLILEKTGLAKFAVTGSGFAPVLLAFTIDGARLTNHLQHVSAGVKLVDPRIRMSGDKVPLIQQLAENNLFQSRNMCFILWMLLGKENKETTQSVFGPLLERFSKGKLANAPVEA